MADLKETFIPRMRRIPNTDNWVDIAFDSNDEFDFVPEASLYDALVYVLEEYGHVDFKLATREGIIYGIEYTEIESEPPKPEPKKRYSLYGEH